MCTKTAFPDSVCVFLVYVLHGNGPRCLRVSGGGAVLFVVWYSGESPVLRFIWLQECGTDPDCLAASVNIIDLISPAFPLT